MSSGAGRGGDELAPSGKTAQAPPQAPSLVSHAAQDCQIRPFRHQAWRPTICSDLGLGLGLVGWRGRGEPLLGVPGEKAEGLLRKSF